MYAQEFGSFLNFAGGKGMRGSDFHFRQFCISVNDGSQGQTWWQGSKSDAIADED